MLRRAWPGILVIGVIVFVTGWVVGAPPFAALAAGIFFAAMMTVSALVFDVLIRRFNQDA